MRNWCAALAMGVLMAAPLCAQQAKNGEENGNAAAKFENTSAASASITGATTSSTKGVFALPAAPRPKPFPGPAAKGEDTRAPGKLTPRFELAAGYDYVNFKPGSPFADANSNGGAVSIAYNASRWLGLVAEVGTYSPQRNVFPFSGNNNTVDGGITSFLAGPRLNWRRFNYFVPFAEFLVGDARGNGQITGAGVQNSFAIATGGGLDMVFNKYLAWRVGQFDYFMTTFSGLAEGSTGRQNNLRAATALVLRFGIPNPPPPPNHPPVAACTVAPTSVYAGSGDAVAVHVSASDPDNDPLTYSYSATGGSMDGTGPDVRWNSNGVPVGSYTVNVKVDDGKGGSASCAADIKVEEKPNHPPTATLAIGKSPLLPGEKSPVTCNGTDPDNDPLTYSYTTTGGQIAGSGSNVQFDSTGTAPGVYTVKCTVNDGRGGTADASGNVEVKEPPQIKQLEAKLALHSIYFPTAQPTVAKPMGGLLASQETTLATLATDFHSYLQYKPDAHLILGGHADIRGGKEYNQKLSERRVERAKAYLVEHGVAVDHIDVKAYGDENNMTEEQVKKLLQDDPDLAPAEKAKLIKNIVTVRLANNRRVDITLSTTGEQSIRRYPFNAKDALTLLSRGGGETGAKKTGGAAPPAKKPAPKGAAKP